MTYFCYVDESGVPAIPGNSSHYVLCGISVPIFKWRYCDKTLAQIKKKYGLDGKEIHTGWILRNYLEQGRIPNFEKMDADSRIRAVHTERKKEIYRLQKAGDAKSYKQLRKNYRKTEPYVHLTFDERRAFIEEIATAVSGWSFVRIFAECIDKAHFDAGVAKVSVDEQALEQLVSRFEHYMSNVENAKPENKVHGVLIHDNNETVAKRHTELMQKFHKRGTLWTKIKHIIETPLFVNSELTGMVQIADMCSFILRRYLENGETTLFNIIEKRFDKAHGKIVGVRHFSDPACDCEICRHHK